MKELPLPTAARLTSELVPDITLSLGQMVWVLQAAGFTAGATEATFRHYLKSLRKIGLPFRRGEPGLDEGRLARYRFVSAMELAVALHLRVYGMLPDPVTEGLIAWRGTLAGFYRRAYLEWASGLGAPVDLAGAGGAHLVVSGVWLDPRLHYAGGRCVGLGPPRLLSPFEALRQIARAHARGPPATPFDLSDIAVNLVRQALRCPSARAIGGGHPPARGSRGR